MNAWNTEIPLDEKMHRAAFSYNLTFIQEEVKKYINKICRITT
ncbi:hypothetical protein RC62_1052 [Flavobacterium aquidurense]|uniref:Uncharacterized protein n=1 Tax=Flavobacterium aquidurense TaxID=362413 RepID=A0A0Q0WTM3_9FLAO|nr:hypothetical protein RC62_1052 [Flavobacterium aquidurense]